MVLDVAVLKALVKAANIYMENNVVYYVLRVVAVRDGGLTEEEAQLLSKYIPLIEEWISDVEIVEDVDSIVEEDDVD